MLLIDKGYFDYDFEKVEEPEEMLTWENTVRSEEDTQELALMFGLGRRKAPETLEQIQEHIIKQEGYGS